VIWQVKLTVSSLAVIRHTSMSLDPGIEKRKVDVCPILSQISDVENKIG